MKRLLALALIPVLVLALVAWKGAYALDLATVAREDPYNECALKYDSRKTQLRTVQWDWTWPGWTCRFEIEPNGHVP